MAKSLSTSEFIFKANKIHNNRYDYSNSIYVNCKLKISIICKIHGEFLQTPDGHLSGKGCQKCSKVYQPTNDEFIAKANSIHNFRYDYSKSNYTKNSDKLIIICKTHGPFFQIASTHLLGSGCTLCTFTKPTTEQFIFKANQIHNYIYDYSKSIYISAKSKINIICKIHGSFLQSPECHLRKHGCPNCSNTKIITKSEFIRRSNLIHNNLYSYQNFISNSKPVNITCKLHGLFKQIAYKHMHGNGCPTCNKCARLDTPTFLVKAFDAHKDTYDYSKSICHSSKDSVEIICKLHGPFFQIAQKHTSGTGCPKCGYLKCTDQLRLSLQEFIDRSSKIHNNKYNYDQVSFENVKSKVIISCKDHTFKQTAESHMNGNGCPKCSKMISKQETAWLDSLSVPQRNITFKFNNIRICADGYDPTTNTIYEYYGDYWHGNLNKFNPSALNKSNKMTFQQLYDKTMKREALIIANGFNLITIWETDFKLLLKNIPNSTLNPSTI